MMLDTTKKFERGSEWRKWDLHVHTPASIVNSFEDWNSYIEKLNEVTKRKDIKVLGITDYFFLDGYEEILKHKNKLENIELLLPNVEFRLDPLVYSKDYKGKRLNFHVIFSNEVDIEDIKTQFLDELHFTLSSGSPGELSPIRLTKKAIEDYGKECKKQADFKNDTDLQAGFKNIYLSKKDIADTLYKKSKYFYGKYLLILESDAWDDIIWGQDYGLRRTILQFCHGVFNSNPNDINWLLGKGKDYSDQQQFIEEFGRLFPCIHGSDAHCESELETRPDLNRYCWIKSDLTFDGLKQIICEPEERIYIGDYRPDLKNPANVIDRIEISNSNNWFEEKALLLNDGLVAIIGEKGAGKTALADLIALSGGNFDVANLDTESFVCKALKRSGQIDETIEGCSARIYWKNGDSDSINIDRSFDDYKEKGKVQYLSQRFIANKCKPDHADELQEEIENIIFQHIPVESRMTKTDFLSLKKSKTQSIEIKKAGYKKIISDFNAEIFALEEDINGLDSQNEELRELDIEIAQLENQKPKSEDSEEEDIEEKLELLYSHRNDLNDQIAYYKSQINTVETVKAKIIALRAYISKNIDDIKSDLENLGLDTISEKELSSTIPFTIDEKLDDKKKQLQVLLDSGIETNQVKEENIEDTLSQLTTDNISKLKLNDVNELISYLESKSTMEKTVREKIRLFDDRIERNRKKKLDIERNIKNINEVKKPLLPEKISQRSQVYYNYFALLQEERQILEDLYAPLKEKMGADNLGKGNEIEFFARVELNVDNFFKKADNIIDFSKKGKYFRNDDGLFKEIKGLAEQIELSENLDIYELVNKLYKTFEDSNDGEKFDIKNQLLKGKNNLDFYNWIFDVADFYVKYNIKYQGTNIELLSPGKKGIVLLLMYLALDTEKSIPLIIDQPEENLDNKSVYYDLIGYFRKAKKKRQILVITHNPNLVINTDAEQVIIANWEAIPNTYKSRITYISGSIENSYTRPDSGIPLFMQGIKEHGADILEGGKPAFIKRMNRYEF